MFKFQDKAKSSLELKQKDQSREGKINEMNDR